MTSLRFIGEVFSEFNDCNKSNTFTGMIKNDVRTRELHFYMSNSLDCYNSFINCGLFNFQYGIGGSIVC